MPDASLRELRYFAGTTRPTAFSDGNGASFNAATRLRVTDVEGALEQKMIDDAGLQMDTFARAAPHAMQAMGSFGFSMYMGGAETDTTESAAYQLAKLMLGGGGGPTTNRTYTLDSTGTHTTSKLYASGIDADSVGGNAVLINGEMRMISSTGTDYIDLEVELSAAPSDGDIAVLADSAYAAPAAVKYYFDFFDLGDAAEQQYNIRGCRPASIELITTGVDELLQIKFGFESHTWREEPSATRRTTGGTQDGSNPPPGGYGQLMLLDSGSSTRSLLRGSSLTLSHFGMEWAHTHDRSDSVSGMSEYSRVRPAEGPRATIQIYAEQDMPGLRDDLLAGTTKNLYAQFGSTQGRAVLVHMPSCRVIRDPKPVTIDRLAGYEVVVEATSGSWAGGAPVRLHVA